MLLWVLLHHKLLLRVLLWLLHHELLYRLLLRILPRGWRGIAGRIKPYLPSGCLLLGRLV